MKTFILAPALAVFAAVSAVTGSPVAADSSQALEERDGILAKRVTGSLSAWTGASGGCSGTPGFTWPNPGNGQCITFRSGDGTAKVVHRLSWDGDNCFLYGYQNSICSNDVAHPSGSAICLIDSSIGFLSFKVVC